MIYTTPEAAAPAIQRLLQSVESILLLTHVNPDGDAVGSVLGTAHVLRALGKRPVCLLSSPVPSYCQELPGAAWLHVYRSGEALPTADLTWMLDTATPARVGAPAEEHSASLAARPLLIVDHHLTNEGQGQLNLIDPSAASNADLLFRLFRAMDVPVNPEAATCLYMGMLTDTQSFQTSSTSPQTLQTAAELLAAGADRTAVVAAVYFSIPATTQRLTALALSSMRQEGGLVWARVTQAQYRTSGASEEATDDTVNRLQRSTGMRVCVLFKELPDGRVKLSLRSQPGIDVAKVAQTWGGGGHAQAAGVTLAMDLEAAEAAVLPLLRALLEQEQS